MACLTLRSHLGEFASRIPNVFAGIILVALVIAITRRITSSKIAPVLAGTLHGDLTLSHLLWCDCFHGYVDALVYDRLLVDDDSQPLGMEWDVFTPQFRQQTTGLIFPPLVTRYRLGKWATHFTTLRPVYHALLHRIDIAFNVGFCPSRNECVCTRRKQQQP